MNTIVTRVIAASACSAAVAAGLAGFTAPAASAATQCTGVVVAAHRGMHDARHTENTLRSARRAVSSGMGMLEGDMRLTKDGVWVMMHDATVDRTTTGRGSIRGLTLRQVKGLRTDDGVRGGVPTVDADLAAVDGSSLQVQFEIKPSVVSASALSRLMRIFAAHRLQQRLTITSFNAGVLGTVHRRYPTWRTALIVDHEVSASKVRSLGQQVSVDRAILSAGYASSLHRAGLDISVWTVNTTTQVDRVLPRGVSSIVSDAPATVQRYCHT